jgi:hypothetical protein
VLEYMMKRRKGGSRTLNDSNVRKFLLHEVLACHLLHSSICVQAIKLLGPSIRQRRACNTLISTRSG